MKEDYKPESMLGLILMLIIIFTPVAYLLYEYYYKGQMLLALAGAN